MSARSGRVCGRIALVSERSRVQAWKSVKMASVLEARIARMMRTRRPWVGLVLAFALLIAQAGALLHGASHAADGREGAPTQLCGHCLSYSTMFSMASGTSAVVVALALAFVLHASTIVAPLTGQPAAQAFKSRAPPRNR